ncbi:sigma-E factor negative regulatory protein [Massilia norwichensis]|uniref:Sigma-E factor negative regulatory protein n=1 Tax=Massilia norwichensis TaxID=1442366 RepID=A0ABT2A7E6_9BURK|nr:sigma-E factor negative regulatory protein [Massilia norwichensis]MCS0590120.1 sigma-E factor negative regulatory protein [Massilia norwichensis]
MDTNKKNREYISLLLDGEIPDTDQELAMAALGEPDGRQAWDIFNHIGDVLRAEATADLSPGFSERLAARLADEPTPTKRVAGSAEPAASSAVAAPR